jgi:hypothetical protein
LTGKRKIVGGKVEAPIKRTKYPAYFISDLAHVVAFTDERIPFTSLASGTLKHFQKKIKKINSQIYRLTQQETKS